MSGATELTRDHLRWPLFDAAWYRQRYPEVVRAGLEPERHYLETGEAHGYAPNALFDTEWVRAHLRADAPDSPLLAYIEDPLANAPNPLFDPAWYLAAHAAELGDERCALGHYLRAGTAMDLRPHRYFDPSFYRASLPAGEREVPLLLAHYLDVGEAAGCRPHPGFDPDWVRGQYAPLSTHCERCGRTRGALAHYAEVGAARDEWPSATFDPAFIHARYPALSAKDSDLLARVSSEPERFAPNAYVVAGDSSAPALWEYREHFDFAREQLGTSEDSHQPLFHYLDRDIEASVRTPRESAVPSIDEPGHVEATIVIPTYDNWFFATACLHAIATAKTRLGFEVIVADDASPSPAPDHPLYRSPGVRVVRGEANRGFLENCNAAARVARGEYVVFLNDDTLVCDGWLDELVATFDRFDGVGLAGARLLQANGTVGEAGGIVWRDASAWNYGRHLEADHASLRYARPADYVSGACLAIPKALFERLGGFDPVYAPAYFEDTDLAFRVRRAGKQVVYQSNARVYHFEGTSSGVDPTSGVKRHQAINQASFAQRWQSAVAHHGERGVDVEREKDRYVNGHALVVDACLPTPLRDGRSHALVQALLRLRDAGYETTLLPENLDAPAHLADPLRGLGIQVLGGRDVSSIEAHLTRHGARLDKVAFARPGVAERWRELAETHCPRAELIAFDLAASTAYATEPSRSDAALAFDESGSDAGERSGIWIVAGTRDDVLADSFLWLRDEVVPALGGEPGETSRLPVFCTDSRGWLHALADADGAFAFHDTTTGTASSSRGEPLGSHRIAVAPNRFGGDVGAAIGAALSQGLPCVVSPYAAAHLEATDHPAIAIAPDARTFANAIAGWMSDDTTWRAASLAARTHPAALAAETLIPRDLGSPPES
ncbi:MAG: glycosyltransferase family 2 protein [Myxococcota bacterium]|nr:glycosyltransferase family 2 protein [Myxococcota bacterium]